MKKVNLNALSGDVTLFRHGDYVFIKGKKMKVVNTRGELLFTGEGVHFPHSMLFLRPDLLFLEAGGLYYQIELPSGKVLWKQECPKGYNMWGELRLSPDGRCVYQKSDSVRSFDVRLTVTDLEKGTVTQTALVERRLRCVHDFCFDENGDLCFLQSEVDGKTLWTGISYEGGWKIEPWSAENTSHARCFWGDSDTILMSNYQLYHIHDRSFTNLAANTQGYICPYREFSSIYRPDDTGRYLMDHRLNGTIVFDMLDHKIAAQYAEPGFGGIIIDDEYWCVPEKPRGGLIRKPFPLFEELPPEKLTTMGIW